jgi:hypothetical protein
LKLRGKVLPEPDPREPPLVKPRRLGSLLEPDVLKLDRAGRNITDSNSRRKNSNSEYARNSRD